MHQPTSIANQRNHQPEKSTFFGGKSNPFFKAVIQPKLAISEPGDAYEQEADAMADKVMRMPNGNGIQRKCNHCEDEEKKIQRKDNAAGQLQADAGTEQYINNLEGSGRSLDGHTQQFFESRFGHDFSNVRVHNDVAAAKSAGSINALAYTTGSHIIFNEGQYAPGTSQGDRLMAHELTHVVQQSASVQPKKIQRAKVMVNGQPVQIDYGNIIYTVDYLAGVQSLIGTYTGAPPAPAVISTLTALPTPTQRWLLFAMDILADNTTAAHTALNRTDAVNRLIVFAPGATTQPLGNIGNAQAFASEVLLHSGWTEVAVASGLNVPGSTARNAVNTIVNPPATGGAAPGALDVNILNTRLDAGLRGLLQAIDPGRITTVGTQSISTIQAIGDIILAQARIFFQPFSDASRDSVFNVSPTWVASSNISATTAIPSNQARRLNYLANRAQIVGRNATATVAMPDTNIFADANFDGSRPADQAALTAIINAIEADTTTFQPIVDRLVLHTGFERGSGAATRIGINPEFDASRTTECQARWSIVDTLCHEVLHSLAHPNFRNAASRISFSQVVREGFTEVLGEQLFNQHVVPKAASDAAFKARLEQGIAAAPCPAPAAGTIGYGTAGSGAETIRTTVGDSRFRAAYFLGRTDLVTI